VRVPTLIEIREECERLRLPANDDFLVVLQGRFTAIVKSTANLSRLAEGEEPFTQFVAPHDS